LSFHSYIDVKIAGFGRITILDERYYIYNSHVTLYNIALIFEANMRNSGYTYTDYTVTTDGSDYDTMTLHVLYCYRYTVCTSPETFLTENSLTTLLSSRIASGIAVMLYLLATSGKCRKVRDVCIFSINNQNNFL
jgi:hypothetical protein